jgi:hypothetical protein
MKIRYCWRSCDLSCDNRDRDPKVDAYFVDCCSQQEVDEKVLPYVPPDKLDEVKRLIERYLDCNRSNLSGPTCAHFLVAKDLTFILPHTWNYPIANMWNAYSPFDVVEQVEIESLEELRNLQVKVVGSVGIRD